MKELLKKYRFLIITVIATSMLILINRDVGIKALNITGSNLGEMLIVIPPVFILLGLLDVWVPGEIMMKYMGESSGLKGIILSVVLGSISAGPLYAAFPIASVFMKKGVKFTNILIFIGAWSTTKIPMFLFEISALGSGFAITRLLADIPGIIIIAHILSIIIPRREVMKICEQTESV